MRSFDRVNNSFLFRSQFESGERFLIGCEIVFYSTDVAQIAVFGTDCGVIEPRRNRMGQFDLAIFVCEQKSFRSLKNPKPSALKSGRMFAGPNTFAAGFDPDHAHARVIYERMKQTDRMAA